jgi:hypothetical protein
VLASDVQLREASERDRVPLATTGTSAFAFEAVGVSWEIESEKPLEGSRGDDEQMEMVDQPR